MIPNVNLLPKNTACVTCYEFMRFCHKCPHFKRVIKIEKHKAIIGCSETDHLRECPIEKKVEG